MDVALNLKFSESFSTFYEFVQSLVKSIPYYNERHNVKPGLAGWAQLKYPYGATENDALEKLKYDLYYIKHRSFFLDVLIYHWLILLSVVCSLICLSNFTVVH